MKTRKIKRKVIDKEYKSKYTGFKNYNSKILFQFFISKISHKNRRKYFIVRKEEWNYKIMNQDLICNRNYVLKKVLSNENYTNILKDFIQSILNIDIQKIKMNTYIDTLEKYIPAYHKMGVVDVRVTTKNEEEFNIGIQFINGKHIQKKIALYYLFVHTNQIYYEDHRNTAKTITINILDFTYYQNLEYHRKEILNKFKSIDFSEERAETHILELPKFKVNNENEMSKKEQWIAFFKGVDISTMEKIKEENIYIKYLDELVKEYWKKEKIE